MAYIFSIVFILLFFLALHNFTELLKAQKITIAVGLSIVIISAIAYNKYSNKQTQKMLQIVTKYNQNKSVICNGVEVNSSNYTLSIGTYTFIGKEGTPIYGQMISASTCE